MFLMASRMVNPLQKFFRLLCLDTSEELQSITDKALQNAFLFLKKIRHES